ncbi:MULTISPECIES: aminoglycoside phosphotransferase family protein [unclassified Nodularia (in: cyanobacteria)]|uniref:aminoglycoside phosphotransferase family protein n=1 Tax=unclassified Nodularia (in: cyanobacteria) TaxID=2656917 RepID=UPI00187DECC3|nr:MULTISPECIES: aminoglycoside phosphotransferase family protein [unclassified Nodularia (in: cyanobacteria)]MBE9201985.1 aminoglycoside phosphotransferase family protein [Nodularia sp. LEGE 06071]MCC2693844.1 aminoglycoside phosphotransferase family protein [Nodularia sp. LEGE 04288]
MLLSLSSHNVIQYLQEAGLCCSEDGASNKDDLLKSSPQNLNLLVTLAGNQKLLVKQKLHVENDGTPQEFFNEWLFFQLLQQFPVLGNISAIAPLILHFDEENSILIRNYLSEYSELGEFYRHNDIFPPEIASAIGTTVAGLHRATFQHREYRNFMATAPEGQFRYSFYNPAQGVDSISPEIFGTVPTEALKFYLLYQRYESLESAIADLAYEWQPCCLTHNDLNLNNILIHSRWDQLDNCLIKLIDWEACGWGDPAFDLGTLIASYLGIWLSSLVVDHTIELEESLHLAMTPLEVLQPSLLALIRAYLNAFPMILEYQSDFIVRVIKFTGLALINQIQATIKHRKYFGNTDICMLQIAKNLLTIPEQSVLSIFGVSEAKIVKSLAKIHKFPQPEPQQQLVPLYYEKTRLRGC